MGGTDWSASETGCTAFQLAHEWTLPHREYTFAVKDLMDEHHNELKVVLHPAAAEMTRRAAAYPYPVPVMQGPGQMGPYNFIRKPACDFGCARHLRQPRRHPCNRAIHATVGHAAFSS